MESRHPEYYKHINEVIRKGREKNQPYIPEQLKRRPQVEVFSIKEKQQEKT
jgi:hypothetical protein